MKAITQFMMDLHKQLKDTRKIADITASQYIRTLYTLNSSRPFNNLAWVKNIESINLRLSDYAESTQRSMLTALVSALSLMSTKASYKKIYAHWYNRMMEEGNASKHSDMSEKTEKQEKNWLSWDTILAHEKRLFNETSELVNQTILPSTWPTILSYMVLSLYTKFAPRRNQDYQYMIVVKNPKQATNPEYNYYVMDTKQFIFNKYKTSKSHGNQVFDVPADLVESINLYLKKHPLFSKTKPFQFLVQFDGTPFVSVNAITRILNRIFGKNVGATMLRHIYLSSKYDVSEMNEDAEKMGHSTAMQHDYMKGGATYVEVPTF
jgi:hypothetical protein